MPPQASRGVTTLTSNGQRSKLHLKKVKKSFPPSVRGASRLSLIGSQASHDQSHEHKPAHSHSHTQHVLSGRTYTQSEMGVDGESGWRVVMTSQTVGRLPALSRPVEG